MRLKRGEVGSFDDDDGTSTASKLSTMDVGKVGKLSKAIAKNPSSVVSLRKISSPLEERDDSVRVEHSY